jgi:hypothetical protein
VLRIDRIKEIHARIPDTHLVMHGSSSVPQDWLEIINQHCIQSWLAFSYQPLKNRPSSLMKNPIELNASK